MDNTLMFLLIVLGMALALAIGYVLARRAAAAGDIDRRLSAIEKLLSDRQVIEQRTDASIRRLEIVLAGAQTKGAAGENIVESFLAVLPADWQVRDFKMNGKTVEFGLRLPGGLILPIDSKWPATHLLEQYAAAKPEERDQLKQQIGKTVREKAREVEKYLDPSLTTPFGIAVVPDAVYDLCAEERVALFRHNITLISYSLLVPYLLLVYHTVLRSGQTPDSRRLEAYLSSVEGALDTLSDEMDGRFAGALKRLENSRRSMQTTLGQVRSGLSGLRIMSDNGHTPPEEQAPTALPEFTGAEDSPEQ